MKKKIAILLAGTMMMATVLSGCSASKGLKTENIEISQYKGVEVDAKEEPQKVTDEDVESAINSARQAYAAEAPDGYTVKDGDIVSIEYVGKVDGEAFDGGSTEEGKPASLVIGSNTYIDGFEESIIGHKKGDTFDWNGSFPENYRSEDLAGKDVTFTITIDDVYEVPELNDEFVQKVTTEAKTVDEYKKAVKKSLEKQAEQNAEDTLSNNVWQAVLANTKVKKYPSKDVNELYDMIIKQYKTAAEYADTSYEDYIKAQMNQTVESFEKSVKENAQKSVKQDMVINAIADKEKIEPTDKEYEAEYEKMAESYGYSDVDAMKSAADEADIKQVALGNIVKAWLVDNAVQKEASK